MADEIGFVGIGQMGLPMAGRLVDAGHRLVIHDVDESHMAPLVERQAGTAASPREVADRAEIVFVSLPSNPVIREVVLGEDGVAQGGAVKIYVSTCTTGSPFAIETARALDLSRDDLIAIARNSIESTFLTDDEEADLLAELEAYASTEY